MKKLSDYIGTDLIISQKSVWKREIEFHSEEELIAKLTYPKFYSDRAELKIDNEIYEFFRPKFFTRDVDIRKKGYQMPLAHLTPNFWGNKGVLELPRGVKINMKFGMLKKVAELYEGESDLIVTIFSRFSFKEKSQVVIERRSEILDDYPWIIMLAFYFSQLRKRNSAIGS